MRGVVLAQTRHHGLLEVMYTQLRNQYTGWLSGAPQTANPTTANFLNRSASRLSTVPIRVVPRNDLSIAFRRVVWNNMR